MLTPLAWRCRHPADRWVALASTLCGEGAGPPRCSYSRALGKFRWAEKAESTCSRQANFCRRVGSRRGKIAVQRLEPLVELILGCHRAALHQGGPDHAALMGRQCD